MPSSVCVRTDFCSLNYGWVSNELRRGCPLTVLCRSRWLGRCTSARGVHSSLCQAFFNGHVFRLPAHAHSAALDVFEEQAQSGQRDSPASEMSHYFLRMFRHYPVSDIIEVVKGRRHLWGFFRRAFVKSPRDGMVFSSKCVLRLLEMGILASSLDVPSFDDLSDSSVNSPSLVAFCSYERWLKKHSVRPESVPMIDAVVWILLRRHCLPAEICFIIRGHVFDLDPCTEAERV